MADATSTIRIVVDRSQADQQISSLNSSLSGMGGNASNVSSAFSNVSKTAQDMGNALRGANDNAKDTTRSFSLLHEVMNGIALGIGITTVRIFEQIGYAMVNTVRDAFSAAAAFDKMRASLGTATGSMAAGAAEFKNLQEWARKTPFAIDDVTRAFATLANAGLNTSTKALKAWGDLATAKGLSLSEMTDAIMHASEGHVRTLAMFGISAKAQGDTIRLVYRGVTSEISNDASSIQKYLYDLSQNRFGDAMANQANTVGMAMKRMHEAWEEALASFGAGFTGAFAAMAGNMERGADGMNKFAAAAGNLAGGALGALGRAFQFLSDHSTLLVGALVGLSAALTGRLVVAALAGVTELVGLVRTFGLVETAIATLGPRFLAFSAFLGGPLGIALAAVAAGFYYWKTSMDKVAAASDDAKKTLADFNGSMDKVKERLVDTSHKDVPELVKAIEDLRTKFVDAKVPVDSMAQSLLDVAKNLNEVSKAAAINDIEGQIRTFQDKRNNLWQSLPSAVQDRYLGSQGIAVDPLSGRRIPQGYLRTHTGGEMLGLENYSEPLANMGSLDGTLKGLNTTLQKLYAKPDKAFTPYKADGEPDFGTSPSNSGSSAPSFADLQGADARNALLSAANKYRGENEHQLASLMKDQGLTAGQAWCAAFLNSILGQLGMGGTGSKSALSFLKYGSDDRAHPEKGDIVVTSRGGANSGLGHVGVLLSSNDNSVTMLGGNTGGRVGVETVSRSKVLGIRSPDTPGESAASAFDDAQKAAEKTAKAQQALKDEVTKTVAEYALQGETAGKTAREIEEMKAKQKVDTIYQNKLDSDGLAINKAQQALDEKAAVSAADSAMDADLLNKITARNADVLQTQDKLRKDITDKALGETQAGQQLAEQDALRLAREEATKFLLANKADMTSKIAQDVIKEAEAQATVTLNLQRQQKAVEEINAGYAHAQQYLAGKSPAYALGVENQNYRQQGQQLNARQNALYTMTGPERAAEQQKLDDEVRAYREEHFDAIQKIAEDYRSKMEGATSQIANALQAIFGGSLGQHIGELAKGIGGLFSSLTQSSILGKNGAWSAFEAGPNSGAVSQLFSGLKDAIKENTDNLTKIFGAGSTAPGGFFDSMQNILGQAAGGAQTGSQIAGIAKGLGFSKFSTTGSEIGGAIGSFLPIPGGQIIGSVAGGIIGSLFKTTAKGTAGVSFDPLTNQLKAGTAVGNNAQRQSDAQNAADSIASGVNNIVSQLGAQLSGAASMSVLKEKNYYLNGNKGTVYKTEADAVAAGILQEIKSGIAAGSLSGISDFSKRILMNATTSNLDSVVSVASGFETVLKDLDSIQNPLTSGLKAFSDQMNQLVKAMTAAGATTTELQTVQTYREAKLKDMLQQNLAGLIDLQKTLSGSGSGLTDLTRLNTDLQQFQGYKTQMAAGQQVNPGDYSTLANEIFGLAGSVYGTSTAAFQQIRNMLMDSTQGLIDSTTADYNQAMLDAANSTTAAVQTSNAYLGQIVGLLGGSAGVGRGVANPPSTSTNGSYSYQPY